MKNGSYNKRNGNLRRMRNESDDKYALSQKKIKELMLANDEMQKRFKMEKKQSDNDHYNKETEFLR